MHATRFLVLALLAGCSPDRTISGVKPEQRKVEVKDVPAIPRRDLDILFMIDDSPSMKDEQESLRANFSRLIGVLETIDGGLPDVQIGVITPNLGTSATDNTTASAVDRCVGQGEGGTLRAQFAGGPRFLRDVDDHAGGRSRNYTGTLAEAFTSLATVGVTGCGIEQHLEAVKRAVDPGNTANAGFLRRDAYLAVILIADEDDCSLAKSTLFAGNTGEANYGDRVNFRCTAQGVACDSPATPFEDATGIRTDCHPRFDAESELTHIDRYVSSLKSLKTDPLDVVVAGIIGNPDPFVIGTKNDTTVLGNSCPTGSGGGTANALPAVRISDFLSQFQERNTESSICDGDLSAGLTQIGVLLKNIVVNPCFDNPLADVDPATDGPQYDCTVTEILRTPGKPDEDLRVFQNCGDGVFPCWRIEEDATHCSFTHTDPHLALVIDRNGEAIRADTHIKAACVTADAASPVI